MAATQIPEWTLGDRLRKARTLTDLTQRSFAHQLGISEDSVKRYESMKFPIPRGLLLGWAVACGVDPVWLETGRDEDGEGGVTNPVTLCKPHNCVGQLTLLVAA
jgi:transcriptional regulator with XRE-family HTH domain